MAVFCLATAALSLVAAPGARDDRLAGAAPLGWPAMLALGLGPVGLAFYLWDIGCKRGDIQLLGTASYAAPLISTLLLIAAGFAGRARRSSLAAALIAGGALVAARAGRVRASARRRRAPARARPAPPSRG